ncbi:GNAT family N-acetyltransferase [Kribbella antibiotica]|uniref:GNAT family N-acetyltransferase n=1 Tax=Kribbella antibiotica TaxID=190195 RepID=A0A4R4YVU1_9ACTN|nr:GNAT family N-acetyltransferase [Kribbella antibiotica]TDD48469.1 GNAT family N-acetyltransferase [Kribbella antibiotica]
MDISPATRADIDRLVALLGGEPAAQHHVLARWQLQQSGDATYLLARRNGAIVGQTMLLRHSKYPEVSEDPAEINALHAFIQHEGIGTALVLAAEALAGDWGRSWIGLGVEPVNDGARRLYERLGYQLRPGPRVIDRWTEQDVDGTVLRAHADECDYLLKPL